MRIEEITFPLALGERASLYARLSLLGARVFQRDGDAHFSFLTDEEVLAVAAEESRFDYRLLYILVEFLSTHYIKFHPFRIRSASRNFRSPQVWGVIADYCALLSEKKDRKSFFSIITDQLQPAPFQLYFNPLRRPRPKESKKVLSMTADPFFRWGYFSNEPPISKELRKPRRGYAPSLQRRHYVIARLLHEKKYVSLPEYRKAVGNSVSRQTAHRDLISFPGIKRKGDRRGRRYFL